VKHLPDPVPSVTETIPSPSPSPVRYRYRRARARDPHGIFSHPPIFFATPSKTVRSVTMRCGSGPRRFRDALRRSLPVRCGYGPLPVRCGSDYGPVATDAMHRGTELCITLRGRGKKGGGGSPGHPSTPGRQATRQDTRASGPITASKASSPGRSDAFGARTAGSRSGRPGARTGSLRARGW
jgi:hypothetical protein